MKNTVLLIFFSFMLFAGAYAQTDKPKHVYPKINGNAPHVLKWDSTTVNFGHIPRAVPVVASFKFINTGTVPVLIKDVHPSCSCTAPDWTKTPIPPGGTGYVTASYNPLVPGIFTKSISITTDAGEIAILVLTGESIGEMPLHETN